MSLSDALALRLLRVACRAQGGEIRGMVAPSQRERGSMVNLKTSWQYCATVSTAPHLLRRDAATLHVRETGHRGLFFP